MKILILSMMFRSLIAMQTDLLQPDYLSAQEQILNNFSPLYSENQPTRLEEFNEQVKRLAQPVRSKWRTKALPSSMSLKSECTCESDYQIVNLGKDHYPQFVKNASCKPKSCRTVFNPCRLLRYMVYILKPRDLNTSTDVEDTIYPDGHLPASLRDKWQLKPLPVSVACVPEQETGR